MTTTRRHLIVASVSTLALPAVAFSRDDTIKGSGRIVEQHREVEAFSALGLGAPVDVVLRAGAREGIDLRGDDNVLAAIETSVVGSGNRKTLRIELRKDTRIETATPVVVTVGYLRLEAIALGGSGRISGQGLKSASLRASIGGSGSMHLSALDADELTVAIGGSGDFTADGKTRALSVSIGGSGRCDAAALTASEVEVSIAGSGDARVHADGSLRASIAGSGDVVYSGSAVPRVSSAGSGRVRKG